MKTKHRKLKIAFICVAISLLLVFIISEFIYYFPLTPLSLDTDGSTRLPKKEGAVRILFVGDIMLADTSESVIKKRGYKYIFAAVRNLITAADLAVGNLEGPISKTGKKTTNRRWSYKVPPKAANALSDAGFDLMNLANNHIIDCGEVGISETISFLKQAGVEPMGAGMNKAEAHRAVIREVRGVKIAFLSYVPTHMMVEGKKVFLRNLAWTRTRGGAAWGDIKLIRRDIRRIRKSADIIVVSFHMGDRYQRHPEKFERKLCQAVIDAGADAVIGHGTHIMGPIELYKGKPIVYSVGNFAFGSSNLRARFSLMSYIDVDPKEKDLSRLFVLPIYTVNYNPMVMHQTKVLKGFQGKRVLKKISQLSKPYGARLVLKKRPLRATLDLKPKG